MYKLKGVEAMAEEKRMAGKYEIFQSISVGAAEVVIGENPDAAPGEHYLCALCVTNELFAQYSSMEVSDDYAEIMALYGQRIQEQTEKLREELSKPKQEGIDDRPVSKDGCIPIYDFDDLHNRVILVRADVFKREYQRATCQYQLCTGGFGASPNSRSTACYCINLYTGQESRFERQDILGIVSPEQMPQWAKTGLDRAEKKKHHNKEAR